MKPPRKSRAKPGPHTPGGPVPVIGRAVMAFIAANPGANPHSVHAAIGGALGSVQSMMSDFSCRGLIFKRGSRHYRTYYGTQAEADAAIPIEPVRRGVRGPQIGRVKTVLLGLLEFFPQGATPAQLEKLTGFDRKQISGSLRKAQITGEIFGMAHPQTSIYFTTAELMAASHQCVTDTWAAEREMYRERRATRQREFSAKRRAAQAPRVAKVKPERAPKALKVKAVKVLKVAIPKPKTAAALVFVKTPINKAKPTAARKGWGVNDPAHITADTIITIYKAPPVQHYRTNTHFQY